MEDTVGVTERIISTGTDIRIRLALNYKKVPYTTVWVQYADIQTAMKDIGASPTGKRPTGEDRYTLPTIRNPNTGEVISDSPKIMAYLEEKYPERPLIPQGTLEQQTSAPVSFIGPVGHKPRLNLSLADVAVDRTSSHSSSGQAWRR
jgi:glutathione S-transferase